MERWINQFAIVTGASSGIGASICEKLVQAGIKVVGLARRVDRVEALAAELANKKFPNQGKLYPRQCDMTCEEDILAAFRYVKETLGGSVHILVNNAGVARPVTLMDGATEEWKKVLDTNILGLCIATREAVRDMRANNVDGQIIHMNSTLGHYVAPLPLSNVYPGTKHAVTALTETLRQELVQCGSKIKISSISPGYVNTEIGSANGFFDIPQMAEMHKFAPALASEDVANGVMYILGTPPSVQVTELTIRPIGEPI